MASILPSEILLFLISLSLIAGKKTNQNLQRTTKLQNSFKFHDIALLDHSATERFSHLLGVCVSKSQETFVLK